MFLVDQGQGLQQIGLFRPPPERGVARFLDQSGLEAFPCSHLERGGH